jgi:manganese oxidase
MHRRPVPAVLALAAMISLASVLPAVAQNALPPDPCRHITHADVVALDQAFYNNRLGAFQAGGMIFALRRDVVSTDPKHSELRAGFVMVRPAKRPRPIVLRVNAGDCLEVAFQNLLNGNTANPADPAFNGPVIYDHKLFPVKTNAVPGNTSSAPYKPNNNEHLPAYLPVTTTSLDDEQSFWDPINPATGQMANPSVSQPATRFAGVHVTGLNVVSAKDGNGNPIAGISGDGSWVGANDVFSSATPSHRGGMVAPGEKITYLLYAPSEGPFLLYSTGANVGEVGGLGGQLSQGLFGTVSVQPKDTEWYRSQVTREDLMAATYRATASNVTRGSGTVHLYGQTFPLWKFNGTDVIIMDADGKPAEVGGYIHTPGGQPVIDYAATRDGVPILKMTDAHGNLVHSDLTAIITGPNAGLLPEGAGGERNRSVYPEPRQPVREFVIHYHDDFVTTQAFPDFSGNLAYTLAAGRDFFAINYGMGGIGAEILANRFGVGAMHACTTCRFEEFFLSSWTNGDPAMVVDFPANSQVCSDPSEPDHCTMSVGPKATKAYYPDDPSNVYHSYLSDHLKMQIVHAGTNITHVHHLHAQQWLHSPKNEDGHYRDSQMISPGAAYTMDHVFNGSGNLNKTIGDSIFHCHFYPHFAQGMWALWRVHDSFEEGTKMNADGTAAPGWNRALPDGEIPNGAPTVALVPMPTLAMAPIPARVRILPVTSTENGRQVTVGYATEVNPEDKEINPGYPFFIAGVAGQRVSHPPLDFAWEEDAAGNPKKDKDGKTAYLDGGLPRSIALFDPSPYEQHTRWDFTRLNNTITALEVPEEGTEVEKVAMATHAIRKHSSFTPEGQPKPFIMNGLPPAPGAPFADPAVDAEGKSVLDRPECRNRPLTQPLDPGSDQPCLIRYKAAALQIDAVVNKKGWHYPQTRLLTLWGDVSDTIANKRLPQPFFFRANSRQVIEFWHTNLIGNYYELDDYQVRTPTDIIGQHIHLVKFDVTSSDGAANGYNYEDGTFSPQEVREVIASINKRSGIYTTMEAGPGGFSVGGRQRLLAPKAIPYFGEGPTKGNHDWLGAQTTIQRWYADPVLSNLRKEEGPTTVRGSEIVDRTLRTVFTHDHFGPSTHQQTGLYAGLLTEPTGSRWLDAETGALLGSNENRPPGADKQQPYDGGPTSWQALIIGGVPGEEANTRKNFREFALEFQDRQLAYDATSITHPTPYDPLNLGAYTGWADPSHAISAPVAGGIGSPLPFPFIVTGSFGTGTYSVNYRNEPLPFRLAPFNSNFKVDPPVNANAADLSHVYRSIVRADSQMNIQPPQGTPINPNDKNKTFTFPKPFTGANGTDPYTPLLRAYAGDNVQIRTLVGAHMSPLTFSMHGVNWLFEAENQDSGYRGAQTMGISEHFEMLFNVPRSSATDHADYFYSPTSDTNGLTSGNWGIMRAYNSQQPNLQSLPHNPPSQGTVPNCTAWSVPQKTFNVTATTVSSLPVPAGQGKQLVFYNKRGSGGSNSQQLINPSSIVYLVNGTAPANNNFEPLVLRANAGDCVTINLTNTLTSGVGSTTLQKPIYYVSFRVTGSTSDISQAITYFNTLQNYDAWFMAKFNGNRFGFTLPDPTSKEIFMAGKPGSGGNAWTLTPVPGQPVASYTVTFDPSTPTILQITAGIPLSTSAQAGLHSQLVSFDPASSEGMNIGDNPVQTAAAAGSSPGTAKYVWYMGRVHPDGKHEPVEFGAVNLMPSDPLKQHPYGLAGSLIVEPQGANWTVDSNSTASATVKTSDGKTFREFVAMVQDDVAGLQENGSIAVGPTMVIQGERGTPDPSNTTNTAPIWGTGVPYSAFTFPVPNDSKFVVHAGDTVGITVAGAKHGFTFLDKTTALNMFEIVPPGLPFKKQDPAKFGPNNWGTDANSCPKQTIATLQTKHGVADRSTTDFECTVHGKNMKGTFVFTKPRYDILIEGEQIGGTTPGGGPTAGPHAWALNGVTQANGSKYSIKPGDRILVAVASELHGLTFLQPGGCGGTTGIACSSSVTEASVRKVFDIDPLLTQPLMSFDTGVPWIGVPAIPGGWGTAGYGAPMTLMMMTVRSDIPAGITEVPFECTIHQGAMLGTFVINQPGTTTAGRTVTISGDFTSGPVWALNGTPVANNSTFPVLPGDTIVFDTINAKHGVTLLIDENTANRIFEFEQGGEPFQKQPGNVAAPPPPSWGTLPFNAPPTTVLAKLRVRAYVPPELRAVPFECSQHTSGMAGVIAIGDTNASSVPPGTALANWTRAINYRTEPFQYRYSASNFLDNFDACAPLSPLGVGRALSNTLVQGDPQTPVFVAGAGSPFRIRFLHPAGLNEQTIMLHGHSFQEEPYNFGSTAIADNRTSQVFGSRDGFGPSVSFDMVVDSAGGAAKTPGDYLYRTFIGDDFFNGLWGVLRVGEPGKDVVTVISFPQVDVANVTKPVIAGTTTVNPSTGTLADEVEISSGGTSKRVKIDPSTGMWILPGVPLTPPVKITSLKCNDSTCSNPQRWGSVTATGYIQLVQQTAPAALPSAIDESLLGRFRAEVAPDQPAPEPPAPRPAPAATGNASHDMGHHD